MRTFARKHRIPFIAGGVLVAVFAFSGLVMLLWNLTFPAIFGLPTLSYWQAMGVFLLAHVLLKGASAHNAVHGFKHERWRRMMDEHLSRMNPDQRRAFFEEWENRLHRTGRGGETTTPSA
jgi:hypothetical protein